MLLCLDEGYDVIFVGTGTGNILAYEIKSGESLYGYGVMKKGGCRFIGMNKDKNRLICAGEDDSPTLLTF